MSDNPYAFSSANNPITSPDEGDPTFSQLTDADLKKYYHASCNILALSVLWTLGCLIMITTAVSLRKEGIPLVALLMAAVNALLAYGGFSRGKWFRPVSMLVMVLLLILNFRGGHIIPIIILLWGIHSVYHGAPLLGPDRWTHRALKAEVNLRQRAKKK